MKALVLEAYNHFVYSDVPEPEIGPEEVLIQVEACGICGSDVHGMDGSSGRRIPPIIMGHEASGTIAATGESVTTFEQIDATRHYHRLQDQDFLQAILEDRDPMITGVEGRKTVELFTAIYRSRRDGKPVQFPLDAEVGADDFDGRLREPSTML